MFFLCYLSLLYRATFNWSIRILAKTIRILVKMIRILVKVIRILVTVIRILVKVIRILVKVIRIRNLVSNMADFWQVLVWNREGLPAFPASPPAN